MVSIFGVRWYSDQRYSSIQISDTRHASRGSTELTAALMSVCTGSAVLTDASCTGGVAAGGIGRGSGKAASPLSRSVASTDLAACSGSFCTGSGVLADASRTGCVAAGGSSKAASPLSVSPMAPSSPRIAVASAASTCSAPGVTDVARLSSIGAPVFSMLREPRPARLAATQPARTTVPHKAPPKANRRGPITPLPFRPRLHLSQSCTGRHQTRLIFQ